MHEHASPEAVPSLRDGVRFQITGPANAPVLVLGNSLATDISLWRDQIQVWKNDFRIVGFDYPGHGSPSWGNASSMSEYAAKIGRLLDTLEIDTYSYCGLSMGGALGMELAVLHPHRMQKLVLSNTAAQFGSRDFWNQRIATATASEDGIAQLCTASLNRWFTAEFAAAHPDVVVFAQSMFLATGPAGYAACCAAVRDFDFSERLTDIEIPALVIAGAGDLATTPQQARVLVDKLRRAQYHELPTGHLGNLGASREFTEVVQAFLQSR
ncbi:alpha/beta fold hydrolase [Burkholderia sp. L27(2015)]|uniref:alpha/beta fold hydrolase n=1 Tax=Burkholderia sp. L27(2015) TaxID=1641858 RepID=UPI00131B4274|nr:alpha/beta fold hydrolase [Burkholderia sp. L27(2015)]